MDNTPGGPQRYDRQDPFDRRRFSRRCFCLWNRFPTGLGRHSGRCGSRRAAARSGSYPLYCHKARWAGGFCAQPLFCCLCRALVHAAAPGFTLLENAWTGLCLGIASHLVLDPCTPKGIWLFWPLSHRRYHWLDLPTGGWLEKLLALVMLAALGGFGYSFMQNVL